MHRQSIGGSGGSPAAMMKLHIINGAFNNESLSSSFSASPNKHKSSPPSSSPSSPTATSSSKQPQHRFSLSPLSSSPPSSSSPLVHLIPIFTILCFLVLYLLSHNPSPSDLAQFKGLKSISATTLEAGDHIVGSAVEIDHNVGGIVSVSKSSDDVLSSSFRSLRNLQEETTATAAAGDNMHKSFQSLKYRLNRKLGDF